MKPDLEAYIGQIEGLPTTQSVLVKLIEFFQQPERDIDDVCKLIHQDPALSAGVLRFANSPLYAPEEPIHEVYDAIAWVGFTQIYHAVVASLASQVLTLSKSSHGIDVGETWKHSAKAAVYAGAIGAKFQETEGMAFTAGLLHDVGKIAFSMGDDTGYIALVNQFGSGPALEAAEAAHFGFGHAAVGAGLLRKWGLPVPISEAVRCHHLVGGVKPHERLCAMVSLGNIMAHEESATTPAGQYADSEIAIHARELLKLSKDDLEVLRLEKQKDVGAMTGVFGAGTLSKKAAVLK
jgi:putative nucleotidyltransferase with HDIG domain